MTRSVETTLRFTLASVVLAGLAVLAGCKGGAETGTKTADATTGSSQPDGAAPSPSEEQGTAPGSTQEPAPGNPAGPAPGAPAQPASPLIPSGPPGQVVAKVNGEPITRGELDFMVKTVVRNQPSSVPPAQHAEIRRRVLDDLISKELLYQKAKSSSFSVTPAEIADTMTKIKSDFPDEKTFVQELSKDGMTVSGIETMVRQGMVIDKFITTSIKGKVKVTPEEEASFYQQNMERMKRPEQIRASHILVRIAKDSTPEQKQAQKAKAEAALARARKGEDFAALAKQYSQDEQTAPNGGDLGFFPKGQMVPAFDAAVWALKAGEISGIVETDYGYHIIKATGRRPEGVASIDDVRGKIHEFLVNQHIRADTEKTVTGLKAQAKIDVSL